jgi:hypothetical protein
VAVHLYSVGDMARVVNVRPVVFWNIWCPSMVEVVAGRDGYAVELVRVVGEGFGYAAEMAVLEVFGEGFRYAVEMAVVEVAGEGFGYVVELRNLAGGECPYCIAFLRASLAPC